MLLHSNYRSGSKPKNIRNVMTKSQISKVEKVLRRNATGGRSISVEKLANAAQISKENVYRRVYDLKNDLGLSITSFPRFNGKTGKHETAYSLAA